MLRNIAVIGATGNVGKKIVELLLEKDVKVRAVARDISKLKTLEAKGAEIFPGDIKNTTFIEKVFRGSDSIFAMLPPCYHLADFQKEFNQMSDSLTNAIKSSGIRNVVLLSSVGADLHSGNGQISSLYEFESKLKTVPDLSVLALRCAFFMENILGSIPLIKSAGINGGIFNPDSSFGMIAVRDIASVASDYLINPSFHDFEVQYLLGPKDYSFREVTSIIGASIGKPDLAYLKFSEADFIKGMIGAGFSETAAKALVEGLTALEKGKLTKNLSRDSSNTTSTTLETFVREVFVPAYHAA
jgi:uncharacterized protein YbjT (DUF2867 family)